ncbi:hypothetical protein NDU88_003039 [Pleurodeles waltl]|uniref:Uncharacterized protein n=1 Tax=Pleurodeles waltl TaxID=8319 RepID=A0AAV7M7N8_PLEWA|nr:hypothetical protein NDU88_003039 [Pleurodeles waltl]
MVAQMVSFSHTASLVQERAPCCPQSPLVLAVKPRSSSWLWHQLQCLASGVQCLRQPRGKLRSRRTHDHDPSAGAGSLIPRGPPSISRSSGLNTGTGFGSRQPAAAPGVRRLSSRGKSEALPPWMTRRLCLA